MISRQTNWLSQWRVDVPHLRAMESSVANDFDLLAGKILAGTKALVAKGFELLTTGAVNSPATSLVMVTANGVLMHPLATEAGTIFQVPSDRANETLSSSNTRVEGSFTPSSVNYIGIDLRRSADDSTADLVKFLDSNTTTETSKTVPLARTLDYRIIISTSDFSSMPTVCPVAKVTTTAANLVSAIEDARSMAFRLASGSSTPNLQRAYEWASGRSETSGTFTGADKGIGSFKDWCDAVMTRLWELGGGAYWYLPTADRNVTMTRSGTKFSNGEWFEWDGTNLHWRGIKFVFDNAGTGIWSNTVNDQTGSSAGLTDLADGQCIYVDLNRSTHGATISAAKGTLATLGAPTIPGSRHVMAWRVGTEVFTKGSSFPVGVTFNVATNTSLGIVQLTYAAGNPALPLVAPQDANGRIHNTATGGNAPGLEGTGNGSGSGVKGTGGATGYGVEAVGGAGGGGITVKEGSATTKPLALFKDNAGSNRWIVDHNGLPTGGFVNRFSELWMERSSLEITASGAITDFKRWTVDLISGVTPTMDLNAPDAPAGGTSGTFNLPYSSVRIPGFNSTTGQMGIRTTAGFHPFDTDVLVYEGIIKLTSPGSASTLWIGFMNSTNTSTVTQWIVFRNHSGGNSLPGAGNQATLYASTSTDGTVGNTTAVDTGISINLGGTFKLRIEVYSSAAPGGQRVKFYINGSNVATISTNLPSDTLYLTYAKDSANGREMFVGPCSVTWTSVLSSDEL